VRSLLSCWISWVLRLPTKDYRIRSHRLRCAVSNVTDTVVAYSLQPSFCFMRRSHDFRQASQARFHCSRGLPRRSGVAIPRVANAFRKFVETTIKTLNLFQEGRGILLDSEVSHDHILTAHDPTFSIESVILAHQTPECCDQ
jgi:hypothetical protein